MPHPTLRYCLRFVVLLAALVVCFASSALATTFKNPTIIPTGSDPLGLAAADLNHDGNMDIVYVDGSTCATCAGHAIHVLLGRGDGTFSHVQDLALPAGICCVVSIADVTADGNLDIVMAGSQQFEIEVAVMRGNGDGTFQAPAVSTFQANSGGAYPNFNGSVGIGDINGDGAADLAVVDSVNGTLYLLSGNNSGQFIVANAFNTFTDSVYLADLNGDGHLDIVTSDRIGAEFLVFLGNGDGTFQNYTRYTAGASTSAFILRDIDGDGHPDMLTEYYPGQIGIFKGYADGTFGPLSPIESMGNANQIVAVADFNRDGALDFAFANATGTGVQLNAGALVYSPLKLTVSSALYAYYSAASNPAPADFNNDGFTDLAVPIEGGIEILIGKGDGTFASADFYDTGNQVGAVAIADFNSDLLPDIAASVPATFPQLLFGNGHGEFSLGPNINSNYGTQNPSTSIAAADFNGDGKQDMAFLQVPSGSPYVLFGTGAGSFSSPTTIQSGYSVIADVNNDGRMDLVTISGSSIISELGQTNGSFATVTTPLRDPTFASVAGFGDVNKDGRVDLIIEADLHLELWEGNGDGSFVFAGYLPSAGQSVAEGQLTVIADLDGDGNPDMVLLPNPYPEGSLAPLAVFYGNGDGTFQSPMFIPISHRYTQLVVADVNQDNKPDLILNDGATVAVILNLGARTFDGEQHFVAGQNVSAISVADVNGDGFPDIVAANPGSTTVTVLLNEPNGTSAEGAPVLGGITFSPETPIYGQPFTVSVTISPAQSGQTPTGSVSFAIDGTFITTVPLVGGAASDVVTTSLIPTQHTIVATYNGDSTYAPQSFAAEVAVTPPTYTTETVLSVNDVTAMASQTVRLSAHVTGNPAPPSGIVTFSDGTNTLGDAVLDANGNAYHDTALLSPGTHNLIATYQGFTQTASVGLALYTEAIYSPSTSTPASVTVTTNATATTLSASSTSPIAGAVVTLTANISSIAGAPFGGVTFYDGASILGTFGLASNSAASLSTASLTPGVHNITAAFNANGPFAGSVSAPATITVQTPSPALMQTSVALSPQLSPTHESVTISAKVTAEKGVPVGAVFFLDSGVLLGSAETDDSGTAILALPPLGSGTHNLSASFEGNSTFAPSVSPQMEEQWSSAGPGFSLVVAPKLSTGLPDIAGSLFVVIDSYSVFTGQVDLSCDAGLPFGYRCSFTPAILNSSGTSVLTILPSIIVAKTYLGLMYISGIGLSLFSLSLIGATGRRRKLSVFAALVIGLCLSGCVVSPLADDSEQTILTIRATSRVGGEPIVQSTQIRVSIHGSDADLRN